MNDDASAGPQYSLGEQVQLVVIARTPLGYKCLINEKGTGMLFSQEVFRDLRVGERTVGYIKQIREDGKIDLILEPLGSLGAEALGKRILAHLQESGKPLPPQEKTEPDLIYTLFGVSKKKYKMALGHLYRSRLIEIRDSGVFARAPHTKSSC